MYSPIGGWLDVIPADVEDMKTKGWFLEGEPGYFDGTKKAEKQPLAESKKPSIVDAQPEVSPRVGRPRRGSTPA